MKYLFLGYPKCNTSMKAKKWLQANHIEFTDRDIVIDNPTVDELKEWIARSELPLRKFFNTSGLIYKEQNLKDKLPTMSDEEQITLLSTNGKLVKRPLLIAEKFVLAGFKEEEWENKTLK